MTRSILRHLGVFLLWNVGASFAVLLLPAPLGVGVALLLAWLVLSRYVLRRDPRRRGRRRATLRVRRFEPSALRWFAAAVPVLLVLSWALGEVYLGIVPVPPEMLNPFGPLTRTPLGRLSVALLAIGVAPILEEFFFRGLIQRPLERRWGPGPGITAAAALFALVHLLPYVFPLHLFLGLAFGWAVYATRTIWAGVVLHAANNAAALLGMSGLDDRSLAPTLWDVGPSGAWWTALLILAITATAAAWVARGLWKASRGAHRGVPARGMVVGG